jgi:hypothetical protein
VRQNAPRAECADAVNDANRVTTTGARSGAPTERHCRCRVGDDREVWQRDGVRQLTHSLWLIKETCGVAAAEEERCGLRRFLRQMTDEGRLATNGCEKLLEGARLPIIV